MTIREFENEADSSSAALQLVFKFSLIVKLPNSQIVKLFMVWHKIAETEQAINWQDNNMCVLDAGDKKITLARFHQRLYAFAHTCPHAGGIMAHGYITAAGQVSCPLHHYRFDMQHGRNTSGEGYFLKTYLAEKREDGIYVGWEEKSF